MNISYLYSHKCSVYSVISWNYYALIHTSFVICIEAGVYYRIDRTVGKGNVVGEEIKFGIPVWQLKRETFETLFILLFSFRC